MMPDRVNIIGLLKAAAIIAALMLVYLGAQWL